jgi:hypothetical protein
MWLYLDLARMEGWVLVDGVSSLSIPELKVLVLVCCGLTSLQI